MKPTLADIFRKHGPAYRLKFGQAIPGRHLRAMANILACRTEAMGGHRCRCPQCDHSHCHYNSCNDRACPQCGHLNMLGWLKASLERMLKTHYFMVTFTLPESLRTVARAHQVLFYNLFFRAAADTLLQFGRNHRGGGILPGFIGVLQTWARNLAYHLHIHFIVTGGGLCLRTHRWRATSPRYLFEVDSLKVVFTAQLRDALKKTALFSQIPPSIWNKPFNINIEPVGHGGEALRYLARYLFQTAIRNSRLLRNTHNEVAFRFKDSNTGLWQTRTVEALKFIALFLQHVLPKGFKRVRHYGLFHHAHKALLATAQQLIGHAVVEDSSSFPLEPWQPRCPKCGHLMLIEESLPRIRPPPLIRFQWKKQLFIAS